MNNRKEPRIRSRGAVELWIDGQGSISGSIYDVSTDGLSVRTTEQIASGVPVRIVGTGFVANAVVRHCAESGSEFRIGMALVPPG